MLSHTPLVLESDLLHLLRTHLSFTHYPQSVLAIIYYFLKLLSLCAIPATLFTAEPPAKLTVEIEEDVYSFEPADNGAGPMWCRGSTCLVRVGDDVFASGLETIRDAKPLNKVSGQPFKIAEIEAAIDAELARKG